MKSGEEGRPILVSESIASVGHVQKSIGGSRI